MQIAKKEHTYYTDIIKKPFILQVIITGILNLSFPVLSFFVIILSQAVLSIYVGYNAIKKGGNPTNSSISGLFFALATGFMTFLIIISTTALDYFTTPASPGEENIDTVINTMMDKLIDVFAVIGSVLLPIIYLIISPLAASATGFIAENFERRAREKRI